MNHLRTSVLVASWLLMGFILCAPGANAQGQKATDKQEIITIRVVNGVTGLPEWFEFPNVWVGSTTTPDLPRLNFLGEVKIDVTQASPRVLRFLSNWYADCRYHGDVQKGAEARYSLDDILETGVVGENVCGWFHAKPKPGVIVFYVRDRTLSEIIAL